MIWKRGRNCWQLWDEDKKVGTIACKGRDGDILFYAYLNGKMIHPYDYEMKWAGEQGSWASLYRAKRVLEMEYKDSLLNNA